MSEVSGGASAPAAAPAESAQSDSNTESNASQAQSGQPEISDIQDAVEAGELSQAQAKSLIKKYKLKVQGKEQEVEVDLGNDDFIRDQLQLAEMSKRSMQSASEIKKAYMKEMERLKSDPFSVLQELGLDPEELSAGFISKKIEEMKKSPEQLAQEKLTRELEEARAEARKLKEEREAEQMTKLQAEASKALNDEIDKAISGHKKLPNSPLVRKKIADSMLWAMNNGYGDVTAEDVVPMVEKELRQEFGGMFEGMEDDTLEEWVGRERINRARKKKVATKVPGLNDVKPTAASIKAPAEANKPSSQKIKAKDLFRNMGK
jgi:hypothetical protein